MAKKTNLLRLRGIALCALMAALICVGAFIRIPMPVLPFTLQTMFVSLAGLLLGPYGGAASALLYLLLGLTGLPVFAQGGGIGYVLNPSFGYIIGFVLGAFVTGLMSKGEKPGFLRLLAAALCGLAVVYAVGLTYMYCINTFYLDKAVRIGSLLLYGCAVFLPSDAAMCAAAALLSKRLIPVLRRT